MEELVTCPTGCDSALPAVSFNTCAPEWRKSEFTHIAIGRADTPAFADVSSAVEWAARLSQDGAAANAIRLLTIRGNKPASTKTTVELTNNRTVVTARRHILNFIIDEVNDTNYDFARMTQCGIIQFRVWPITNGGDELQGGNAGILASVFAEAIYDEGSGAIQRLAGTIEWDANQDPKRVVNPIAGFGDGSGNS